MKRKRSILGFLLMICLFCTTMPTTLLANGSMQIFVKMPDGRHLTLSVNPTTRIEEIKDLIFKEENISPKRQTLLFAGKELSDENTLQDYSIQKDSTIHLVLETNPLTGKGSEDNPYLITSANDLIWFAELVNSGENNICAKLMNDIDLNHDLWSPIGDSLLPYIGTFDGNGFSISGLNVQNSKDYQGFFGYCKNATIKNIEMKNGLVQGNSYVAGIVGYAEDTQITNCINRADISANNDSIGGIVGNCIRSKIINCVNYGDILKGRYKNGGIAGQAENSLIDRCINYGNISNTDHSGGIAAYNVNGEVSNCLNAGNISTIATHYCYTAGIVANNVGTNSIVKNCLNLGTTTGTGGFGCRVNAIVCANDNDGTYAENCYSRDDLGKLGLANNSQLVSEQELNSGEVAWKLNEGKEGFWRQNLGKDTYPSFSGAPVYKLEDGTFVSPCDHATSTNKPTCTESVLCSICRNEILATGHHFANYLSNNDASCTQDGTKSAKCENCDTTNTIRDQGSMLSHIYEDEWSMNDTSH